MEAVCRYTANVVTTVRDDQLDLPTPCVGLTVGEVVAHVGQLGPAFAAAAHKQLGELTDSAPGEGGYHLDDGWRALYPVNLASLADAWSHAEAWEGMTRIGGVDLPGEVAGLVALTEVVIHGWDVAVATGQPYAVADDRAVEAVLANVTGFTAEGPVEGLFGAAVAVADDASVLDKALARSGRDPRWTQAGAD